MKNFDSVREFLDTFLEGGLPGFDCVVYHDGKCVMRHMGGYSNVEEKIPMQGNELYNIYSCSKPITVTATLMLCERGLLKLEDKLSDFIPEFAEMYVMDAKMEAGSTDGIDLSFSDPVTTGVLRKAKNPITIYHLLTMKAGLSYDIDSPAIQLAKKETNGRCPTLETIKYLAKEPLRYEPGEGYGYSLAHDVLAAVIEVVTGMRFGQFVKENIFDPLGMERTTFLLPDSRLEEVTEQYHYDPQAKIFRNVGKAVEHFKFGTEYESGGAGCISTVDDYIKFLEGLRTGKLLKPETLDLLTTPQVTAEQYPNPLYSYGLGMRCPKAGSPMSDFGWGGHAGAYLAVDRKNKFTFYYAQHAVATPNKRSNLITMKIKEVLESE